MKKYIFALALAISVGVHAFEVSGNHFEGKFKIDSMTVGENEVTVNASSAAADVGQYGKVYVSYTFTQNPYIPNSGTWKGHGRGMSPDGQLQAGILMGVWQEMEASSIWSQWIVWPMALIMFKEPWMS